MLQSISLFDKTIPLYGTLNAVAYLSATLLLFFHIKEYKSFCTLSILAEEIVFKKKTGNFLRRWIFPLLEVTFLLLISFVLVFPLDEPLNRFFLGDSSSGYFPFILFIPIILVVLGILFRATPLRILDYVAPSSCLILIGFKIACYCEGCCYGIELASSPFFNHKNERYELPIQLIEVACAVAMFIVLSIMRKKRKRVGFMYPAFIVMYCASRFVFEFWRDDYPDVIGGLNGNQIMSLIGLVFGTILCVVVAIWGERITAFFDQRNRAFLEEKQKQLYLKRIKKR